MFKMEELSSYTIETDLSQYFPPEDKQLDFGTQMLEKVNLGMLRTKSFTQFRVAIEELKDLIPDLEYSKRFGRHIAEIGIFRRKKMSLEIRRTEMVADTRSLEEREKEPKVLRVEDLKAIGNDFNFLFSNVIGFLKISEPPNLEVRLAFVKKGKFLPSAKLQVLGESLSVILAGSKTNIMGLEVEFNGDKNVKHSLDFSQHKEQFRFADSFELKFSGPIDLVDIAESSLRLANEVCSRVCEV